MISLETIRAFSMIAPEETRNTVVVMLSYPKCVAQRSLKQYRRESRRRELSMPKNISSGRSILLLSSREPFTYREPRGTILPVALPRSLPPRGSFPFHSV